MATGSEDRCRIEKLTMVTSEQAYADAMSSGVSANVKVQNR